MAPHRGMPPAGASQHARLLFIAPGTGQAEALRTQLMRAGYSVDWAESIAPALKSVQGQIPDLVLIAENAETTSAHVEALKTAADGTYLPILLLTEDAADRDWTTSGADDALPLSTGPDLLRLRVSALLHFKRRYQAVADSALETEATCAAVQKVAARYEAVFMQAMQAMLLVDTEGCIVEANFCACALTGYEPGSLTGQLIATLCPPELSWAEELTAQSALHSFSDRNASLLTASKKIVPVEVRSAPIQPGMHADAGTASDIASLFVVSLEDCQPEQTRLMQAQQAASAETAAVFSQEINNPIFVISSNVELLQSALLQEDSSVQAKLGRIADASRRLAQITMQAAVPPANSSHE